MGQHLVSTVMGKKEKKGKKSNKKLKKLIEITITYNNSCKQNKDAADLCE